MFGKIDDDFSDINEEDEDVKERKKNAKKEHERIANLNNSAYFNKKPIYDEIEKVYIYIIVQ